MPSAKSRRRHRGQSAVVTSPHRRVWLWAIALAAAGLWAYSNSFAGAFVFDDTPAIVENPHVRTLWPLTRAMSAPAEVTVSGRPTASLTLAVNYALAPAGVRDVMTPGGPAAPIGATERFQRNVWGYHALNLTIHVLAGLALFGVVRRTLLSPSMRDRFGAAATPLAFGVALVWIVHPLQTESVTYIVQRVESLMGLFFLLTLYCAIRAGEAQREGERNRRAIRWWIVAAVAACALGMGSKEVMVSAPIVVVIWDWVFGRGSSKGVGAGFSPPGPAKAGPYMIRRWPLYLGLASTWLILAALVVSERRGHSVGFNLEGWTPWSYLLTQTEVIVHYVKLALAPFPIVIDYGWPRVTALSSVWPEALGLSAVFVLTIVAVLRRHPIGFPGAAFFLVLAPTSSVLPIVTEIAAEHRMYLPLAAVLATVVIGAYATGRRAIDRFGASAPARRAAGRTAGILVACVAIAFGFMTRHRNLDYLTEEALWRDAVQKRPMNARARVTYGMQLSTAGKRAEAEAQLRTAVNLEETNAAAHLNLGAVLCSQGRFDEGIAHLERALQLDPDYTQAYGNLGEAYASQGRLALAAKYFSLALDTRPDDPFLLNRAGWLLATSLDHDVRNGPRAVEVGRRAVRVTAGQDVVSLDTLAAAYAEVSQFGDAAATAAEALRVARAHGRTDIIPEIEARLRLYQAGQKFRQLPR